MASARGQKKAEAGRNGGAKKSKKEQNEQKEAQDGHQGIQKGCQACTRGTHAQAISVNISMRIAQSPQTCARAASRHFHDYCYYIPHSLLFSLQVDI